MAAGRCECICTHSEVKTFGGWPGVKKGIKKASFFQEKHQGQTDILQKVYSATGIGLLRTGVKSFSLMNPLSNCLGHLEKKLVRRRQGERYHQSCFMPTESIPRPFMCGVASQPREWAHSQFLPKNTAMNKKWYQHILREQLLPSIQEQFGDE